VTELLGWLAGDTSLVAVPTAGAMVASVLTLIAAVRAVAGVLTSVATASESYELAASYEVS
jgi:hypothetical protein